MWNQHRRIGTGASCSVVAEMARKSASAPDPSYIAPPDPDQLIGATGDAADIDQGPSGESSGFIVDPIPTMDTAPVAPVAVKRGRKPKADTAPAKGPGRPSLKAKRTEHLTQVLSLMGLGLTMAPYDGAAQDGLIVLAGATGMADAIASAAETSPALAKAIDSLIRTSAYGQIAAAGLAIALPILANHRVVPAGAALMFPPAAAVMETASSAQAEMSATGSDAVTPNA